MLGVCGTAMGTLAAMLQEAGWLVTGSDPAPYPPMSTWLAERGIVALPGWDANNISAAMDVVVVGNVCRRDNSEVAEAQRRGLPCISLPEALNHFFFTRTQGPALVISGTHGKTTTTSLTAFLLREVGLDPSLFVGGVALDFNGSYRLGAGPTVIEGDEYDTAFFDKVPKFWHYPVHHAVINAVEYDHADIYPTMEDVRHVFRRFAARLPADGELWVHADDPEAIAAAAAGQCRVRTFRLGTTPADLHGVVVARDRAGTTVRILEEGRVLGDVTWSMIGDFNARNLIAALGLARAAGSDLKALLAAASGFKGVRKRQQRIGEARGVLVIDDFAHHPTAIAETLASLRAHNPGARVYAAFEAKSATSRRSVFQDAFARALALADVVLLTQPFKRDDLPPDQLLSLDRLVEDIRNAGRDAHRLDDVADIVAHVASHAQAGDVVVGFSAADFGGLHRRLLAALDAT